MRHPPHPSLLLIATVLAVAGCHRGLGAPEPDAAAIVEGNGQPGVRTDTVDAPFTVTIDRARYTVRARSSPERDFWSDVAVLDLAGAERSARGLDERTFVTALSLLMQSDPDGAAVAFRALHSTTQEPAMRARARIGLTMALSWRSDWQSLARIPVEDDSVLALLDPLVQQAGVERWAHALATMPPPVVTVPEQPVVLPMRRSAFGTPVITVRINGHPHEFWLDTGASLTLISASVAQDAGVLLAAPDTLALGVVAGHVPARAVYIDSLGIGPVRADGVTAALVSPSALRLDRREVRGITESVPLSGVIGTDLLRQLDIVLDADAETITIRRPPTNVRTPRNLFWVGYPVVKLVTKDGRPVLFGLDTGAEGTFITTTLLHKAPRTPVAYRRASLGGLGQHREQTQWVAREVLLSDGDYAIALHNSPIMPERRWTFVTFDGVIGSDVALASRMHLDFANGIFDVRPNRSSDGIRVKVEP